MMQNTAQKIRRAAAWLTAASTAAGLGLLAATTVPFDPSDQPVGHVAMPAVTSHMVAGEDQHMFVIDYNGQNWGGNLHAYPISAYGRVTPADVWAGGAAGQLDGLHFDTARKVFTAGQRPFRWAAMTDEEKALFGNSTTGPALVNYLRGDRSQEAAAGSFRVRPGVLGDIIHSTPVFHRHGQSGTVFVGANDGMLHAFDADTGVERFAYVPRALFSALPALASPSYAANHTYFVDGQLAVHEFPAATLLVGALGGGGKALFGLDITNPAPASEADAAQMARWEVTPATSGFTNLGYTYAAPKLGVLQGMPVAVVGNGYYNGGNGQASLFIINAQTGQLVSEIGTGAGSPSNPNGLSTATVRDTDADGEIDTAYAGDLHGNLWKFNLVSRSASLLLTTSPAQAITMAPAVTDHPHGGRMVVFATGRMLSPSDAADTSVHYAYGVWDGAPAASSGMVEQTLTETTHAGTRVRLASAAQPNWTGGARGWRVALPVPGERVVGDGAAVHGSVFVFLSTNPTANTSATPPGDNWLMQLDALSGGRPDSAYFDMNGDGLYSEADYVSTPSGEAAPVAGKALGGGVRSQFIVVTSNSNDVLHATYDINSGLPPAVEEPPPAPEDRGVSGGHFDFDIYCYSTACGSASKDSSGLKHSHVHEYDDRYDVTGVNMLNASDRSMNLVNALMKVTGSSSTTTTSTSSVAGNFPKPTTVSTTVTYPAPNTRVTTTTTVKTVVTSSGSKANPTYTTTTTTTKVTTTETFVSPSFKVLVVNQAYSPAARLSIGGQPPVPVHMVQTSAGLNPASLPSYTLDTVSTLTLSLPLSAFQSRDWGTGVVRAGLHPTQTGCVTADTTPGPLGERRNGALLIQVVDASVTESDIQLNVPGRPDLGYRLKASSMPSKLLAEYSMFWHHPNGKCMADSGWTMAPPQDAVSDAKPYTPEPGSADPKDGLFNQVGAPGGGSSGSVGIGGGTGTGTGSGTGSGSGTGGGSGTGSGTGVSIGVGVGGNQQDASNSVSTNATASTVSGENRRRSALGRTSWRTLIN